MRSETSAQAAFRKLLRRNLALPLVFSLATAGVLITLVYYLLQSSRSVDHSDQVIGITRQYQKLIVDSETSFRGFLLYGRENFLEPLELANNRIPEIEQKLRALLAGNPLELATLDSIQRDYHEWRAESQRGIELRRAGRDFGDGWQKKNMMDGLRRQFDTLLQRQEAMRDERSHKTDQVAGVALFLTVILSLILAALFIWTSRRQLRELAAEYEKALRGQEEKNAILRDSDWVKTGLAEFGVKMIGDQAFESLADAGIAYVVSRVGASVAGLYRAHDENSLELVAGYGLPLPEMGVPRSINFGETLAGQVARDRLPLFLQSVDESYPLRIETGLTARPPKALALLPLVHEGKVKGLLELGFLGEISAAAREFLSQLSNSLGQVLASAEYREQLVRLLEESQRQAEELNVQGEELRQTNENLEQQSQEMQAQQALLEQTNNELEAQSVALQEKKGELEANNKALASMHSNLREQASRLALANKYKSEFLANMSHELRTPLNSIIILAKLLEDQPADVRGTKESAATIYSSAADLLSLINDILDLSKIEAGRLELHAQSLDLAGFAEKLRRMFEPMAKNKGIDFTVELGEDLPNQIVCDELRLEQILRNFISNGIKFTELGGVSVTFQPASEASERAIEIAVRDTGIGIPPDKQELIFEAFEQLDGSDARRYGGTGLGLTIARRLSQLLGAHISVSSRPGAGSTFTLLVPVAPPATVSEPVAELAPKAAPFEPAVETVAHAKVEPPKKPLSIDDRDRLRRRDHVVQIIEDDPVYANHLLALARERGFKCVVSTDGVSGWRDAKAVLPNAILLDLRLPEMDGIAVLEKLKSDDDTRDIPVHVISSATEDRVQALSRGAIEFLPKPTSHEELGALLERIEKARVEKGGTLNRVLIVEDSVPDRTALTQLLEKQGFEVFSTDRVARARELYREHEIELVLVDLALADGSGFEFIDFLRGQGEATGSAGGERRCGVIVYTARDLTPQEKDRLSDRSDTIVVKGAKSMERVLQEVTLFLRGVEREMPAAMRPTPAASPGVTHRDQSLSGKIALVADDDMRNVFALRRVLDSRGLQTVVARTGREALQKLEESPRIDIVLMDIMMPEMDGFEAIRLIRQDQRFRKLPVLALTAKAMAGDREKCLQAGADDYLSKPIDFERLLGLMKVWINKV